MKKYYEQLLSKNNANSPKNEISSSEKVPVPPKKKNLLKPPTPPPPAPIQSTIQVPKEPAIIRSGSLFGDDTLNNNIKRDDDNPVHTQKNNRQHDLIERNVQNNHISIQDDRMDNNYHKNNIYPNSNPIIGQSNTRSLIPMREGKSIERLNQSDDELDILDEDLIREKISKDEYNKRKAEKMRKTIDGKIIEKREEETKSMLSEILKLKEEIQEVSVSFRVLLCDGQEVDLENRQREIQQKQDLLQRQIHRKLDKHQADSMRCTYTERQEAEDEEYVKSLRNALEEESEDDDDLRRRALQKKKEGLNRVRRESREQKVNVLNEVGSSDSDDGSCLYPNAHPPKRIQLDNSKSRHNNISVHSKKINNKLEDMKRGKKESSKKDSRDVQYKKRAMIETSEEDEDEQYYKSNLLNSNTIKTRELPKSLETYDAVQVAGRPIDELSDEQLVLIKQLVDARIEDSNKIKPLKKKGDKNGNKHLNGDKKKKSNDEMTETPTLNDDFYDDKFLNLVYEMESESIQEDFSNVF